MITIRTIHEQPAMLYGPDDVLIGQIETCLSMWDVRFQIREQKLEGYYIIFQGKKVAIDKTGRGYFPRGCFDHIAEFALKMF